MNLQSFELVFRNNGYSMLSSHIVEDLLENSGVLSVVMGVPNIFLLADGFIIIPTVCNYILG